MTEHFKVDPTLERADDERSTGGGETRSSNKAHKSEAKFRTHGWSLDAVRGWIATSREGESDEDYAQLGVLDARGRGGIVEVDPERAKGELNVVDGRVQVAVARGVMVPGDAVEYEQVTTSFSAPAPFVARVSDPTAHGMPLGPGIGSADVFIAGLPAFRAVVDFCVCAAATPMPHVGGVAAVGDPTVLVNNFPILRAGDVIVEPCGGPNPVVMGCPTVMAGAVAPPVDIVELVPHERDDTLEIGDFIELRLSGPVTAELGYAETNAKIGAKADLAERNAEGRVKAEAMAGFGRVSGSGELVVHLPFVDRVFRLAGTGSAVLGCYGGEVDVGLVDEGGKLTPRLSGSVPRPKAVCTDSNIDFSFPHDSTED